MNAYCSNGNWSDRFLQEIKRLGGGHLLETAPDPLDWHQATDLLMLDARDMRIAARVRRPGYSMRYPHQFTGRFRCTDRVIQDCGGKGGWMFYGHSDASQTGVEAWRLIDLKAFRAALIRNGANGYNVVIGNQRNPDGTWFKLLDVRSFPAEPPLVLGPKLSQNGASVFSVRPLTNSASLAVPTLTGRRQACC